MSTSERRATSVDHALELLQRLGPGARLLAGGHSLMPMMKLRLASPEYVIDIDWLAGELVAGVLTRRALTRSTQRALGEAA